MKVITRQERANQEAEFALNQWKDGHWHEVALKVQALGPNPNPDDIDRLVGHGAWTQVYECSECVQQKPEVVQLGEEPNYESATAWICLDCLKEAILMIQEPEIMK
jgi:hypothetical protein